MAPGKCRSRSRISRRSEIHSVGSCGRRCDWTEEKASRNEVMSFLRPFKPRATGSMRGPTSSLEGSCGRTPSGPAGLVGLKFPRSVGAVQVIPGTGSRAACGSCTLACCQARMHASQRPSRHAAHAQMGQSAARQSPHGLRFSSGESGISALHSISSTTSAERSAIVDSGVRASWTSPDKWSAAPPRVLHCAASLISSSADDEIAKCRLYSAITAEAPERLIQKSA